MKERIQRGFDPRTGMALIFLSVIIVFFHPKIYTEWLLTGGILFCMWRFEMKKAMLSILVSYLLFSLIQLFLLPNVNITLASVLSVFIYFKMILPCGAMAALFVGTTQVRSLLEAFRRMRVPLPVSIAVAVAARYFPVLREDVVATWNAMRLRNISGLEQTIEGIYVPLLMNAVKTGEELAQSAITRGIENPAPKTSFIEIQFRLKDLSALLYFGALTIFAVMGR